MGNGGQRHRHGNESRCEETGRWDPIDVDHIEVDCRTVTFETPGQVRNVLSCPVNHVVLVPVTQTVQVPIPTFFGTVLHVPVTQTSKVPVICQTHLPPVKTPAPSLGSSDPAERC